MNILDHVFVHASDDHVQVTYRLGADHPRLRDWASHKFVLVVPHGDGSEKRLGVSWVDDEAPTIWAWHGGIQASTADASSFVECHDDAVTVTYLDASMTELDPNALMVAHVAVEDARTRAVDIQSNVPVTLIV